MRSEPYAKSDNDDAIVNIEKSAQKYIARRPRSATSDSGGPNTSAKLSVAIGAKINRKGRRRPKFHRKPSEILPIKMIANVATNKRYKEQTMELHAPSRWEAKTLRILNAMEEHL